MLRLPRLYAIIDPLDTGRAPLELAAALLAGGARVLQLRLKTATPAEVLAAAVAIRPLTRTVGALLLVNDRPDVAAAAGADGVHLGQDDVPVSAARRLLGRHGVVGVSAHSIAEAQAAAAAGADYVAVGPIYATTTKATALAPRGPALVRAVRAALDHPLVAIGGITATTAPEVWAAGADAVAMIGALVRAEDPAGAVRDVLRLAPPPRRA